MRMSLGQGIKVAVSEVAPLKRELGADMVIVYSVDRDAAEGPRDLRLQQGGAHFAITPAVFVTR
jgi:hypothetical protein